MLIHKQQVIHVDQLDHGAEVKIKLPTQSQFKTIQHQGDYLCIWYDIEPLVGYEETSIFVLGTGLEHNLPEQAQYLTTIQVSGYVWHIFKG